MNIPIKNRIKNSRAVLAFDLISAILLVLLLYTGLSKLKDFQVFKTVLTASPWLGHFAGIIAWLLPFIEIAIAILLFIPSTRLYGLYCSFIIIFIFSIYLLLMLSLSPKLPCNCGGVLKNLSWSQHIFFNLFFILLSLLGIYFYGKTNGKMQPP
jgi:hypothetical protein